MAAMILATDRKILRRLREGGATDRARAMDFHPPGPIGPARLRRMVSGGAVKRDAAGRYYVDERGYLAWRAARRKRGLGVLAVMTAVVLALMFAGVIKLR